MAKKTSKKTFTVQVHGPDNTTKELETWEITCERHMYRWSWH